MRISLIALALIVALGCSDKKSFDASKLTVEWEFVKNNYDGQNNFLAALNFTNGSEAEIPADGKVFFNLRYHGKDLKSKDATIEHINGEMFAIAGLTLSPNSSKRIEFFGQRRVANFQDVPSGFFYVGNDGVAVEITRTIKKPTAEQMELPGNIVPAIAAVSDEIKIVPTPVSYKAGKGSFTINSKTTIVSDFEMEGTYLVNEIEKLTGHKLEIREDGNIQIKKTSGPPESYSLIVSPNAITINSSDAAGAFYAIQSLKQLFPVDSWDPKKDRIEKIEIEAVEIRDTPRFPIREFMLDVGRNFESKDNVLRLLEVMSLYKLNKFHFHFNDDEGWRLEIPGLPELTDIGATRGYPYENNERLQPSYGSGPTEKNHFGTGFYSRNDFIEILKFATERHIEVIPEIESPGHARAAIKSMEARYNRLMHEGKKDEAEEYLLHDVNDQSVYTSAQLFKDNAMNPALPSVYAFIEKVIVELKKMYAEAGAPLTTIHMGGDEVGKGAWEKSPLLQGRSSKAIYADFFVKTNDILVRHGLKLTGWEEMIMDNPDVEATARRVIDNKKYKDAALTFDAWWDIYGKQDMSYPIANSGYGVVLTAFDYYYFDLAQAPGFDEPGDAWIGYLGLQKTFSFAPYDIYNSYPLDMQFRKIEPDRFKDKERLTERGKKNIRGLQGALWAENMTYDGYMEYQVLPRMLALAERAWAPQRNWESETGGKREEDFTADWSSFANRLRTRELPRLDHYNGGYKYRPLD